MTRLALFAALLPSLAWGAIAEDDLNGGSAGITASTYSQVTQATHTSAAFTTAGTNRLCLIAIGYSGTATSTVTAVTDTAGLTWNFGLREQNDSGGADMEVWWAFAPSVVTDNVVSVTTSGSYQKALDVICLSGTQMTGDPIGAIGNRDTAFGTNGSITTTNIEGTGSYVLYAIRRGNDGALTPNAGSENIVNTGHTSAMSWVGKVSSAPTQGAPVTTGGTFASNQRVAGVALEILAASADVTAPTVTAFEIPATGTSLTHDITTLTATDDTAVTHYTVVEGACPAAGDASWVASSPATYIFATEGEKTLRGCAKDAAGNVSTGLTDTTTITLPEGPTHKHGWGWGWWRAAGSSTPETPPQVVAPTFSPPPGTYNEAQTVTVSTSTGGATLYLDPATPPTTARSSASASTTATWYSYATADGMTDSAISSAAYTIVIPPSPLCADEPMRETGTKFYYCDCATGADPSCVPGSDAWDGLTASTPKQTGWKAKAKTMAAGDTVALCRGGGFTGDSLHSRNPNCTAGSTCDVRDYTDPRFGLTAGDRRPYITTDRLIYLYENATTHGYRYLNLQATGGNAQGIIHVASTSEASNVHSDGEVCNVRIHHTGTGVQLGHAPRWRFRQMQFDNGTANAFLGGSSDGELTESYFANTSFGANDNRLHPIYVSSAHTAQIPVSGFTVANNEVHACPAGTTAGTVAVVVHGQHEDLTIENNLIVCDNPATVNGGQWGIAIDHGFYPEPGYFRRTIVRRNWVVDATNRGISITQAPDSVVEDNVVIMAANKNDALAISTDYTAARALGDDVNTRNTVRNNTVWYRTPQSAPRQAIRVELEGTGHIVTGNAIFFESGSGTCFDFSLAAGSYAFLDSNACNGTWGTTYDTNRVTLSGSPFESAPTDFTPAAGSLLLGAASTATTCTIAGAANQACTSPVAANATTWAADDDAKTRTGSPFDIGAYER